MSENEDEIERIIRDFDAIANSEMKSPTSTKGKGKKYLIITIVIITVIIIGVILYLKKDSPAMQKLFKKKPPTAPTPVEASKALPTIATPTESVVTN
jgi:hypothetical protein